MNLHKTFAIPHGGGGPGMGPIGLAAHLAPFMPTTVHGAERAARRRGLRRTVGLGGHPADLVDVHRHARRRRPDALHQVAILNANYVAARLNEHYPVLYTGSHGRVAHECILDIRAIKAATGIAEIDIAKRLMDYGFHAPTVSFPVAGTLMVEPTESESKAELDRFIGAMISIREEIRKIERGEWPADNNPLKNAPHTEADIVDADWNASLQPQQAVFPLPWVAENKFWPFVNRIDDVYGDRNLFCACVPDDDYAAPGAA